MDKYGNESSGYRFYVACNYVRASEVCFFEKQYLQSQFADLHHCSTTLSGKAESYNEAFQDSKSSLFCQEFARTNPGADFVREEETDWDGDEDEQRINAGQAIFLGNEQVNALFIFYCQIYF